MKKKNELALATKKRELPEPSRLEKEKCLNPWNGKCENTDIALYIMYKGKRLPICGSCWRTISSKNIEWEYD